MSMQHSSRQTLNTAQRLALNLDSHIAIDAGAGTGKTMTIVERVIEHYLTEDQRATRLLPQPERPNRIPGGTILSPMSERINLEEWGGLLPSEVVLLTFTNLAADEMRDRLRQKIAKLRSGSFSRSEDVDSDSRIKNDGFPEQLLMLLEDAPIGTIDSFFNQLVSPYRSLLGDSLGRDVVSDAERMRIIEQGINTLWRLPTGSHQNGPAVDAGIEVEDVSLVLEARDRIARHYSSRRKAARMLQTLINNSVFLAEGERGIIDESQSVNSNLLMNRIMESTDAEDIDLISESVEVLIGRYCDLIRSHITHFAPTGWQLDTRMGALAHLSDNDRPDEDWQRLVWLGQILRCIVSSKLMDRDPSFFPRSKLPSSDSWESGIESYSGLKPKETKDSVKEQIDQIKQSFTDLFSSPVGQRVLHHIQLALILEACPAPYTPVEEPSIIHHIPEPLPERLERGLNSSQTGFSLTAEAQNLDDLRVVLRGLKGIIRVLKERAEIHDFEDIAGLAGELLLARCPSICRRFYPRSLIQELDNPSEDSWRDDHIHRAFATLESLEANPSTAGESASNLGEIRADLERRYNLLKQIRRRYRAFIIDEAQDNSPLQWRMLSRLWGPRELRVGEVKAPDTDWQPTICYVGDMKQSIYAFRQAEVAGFRQYAERLRIINQHEFNNVAELRRTPELRQEDASRDPRLSYDLQIIRASELTSENARNINEWIPFNQNDGTETLHISEVQARSEGLISLKINYRTDGGLLHVMNEWWEDVFSPRHRFFPRADYYAEPQRLIPCSSNLENPGVLEWICPVQDGGEDDPPSSLLEYIDPFESGEANSTERQAMMIAQRIRALHQGTETRILGADGNWNIVPAQDPVDFGEIMILMASRGKLRDAIIKHLQEHNIPTQADKEGSLLERPAAAELDGLVQFVARPESRFAAAWVARSSLIGMTDSTLQDFLNSEGSNNLMERLLEFTVSDEQKALVQRWISLSSAGRLLDILDETIDQSDLLTAYHDSVSAQDVEKFVDEVRRISNEVGGDPMVIADRIRSLREQKGRSLQAQTIPASDAVRVMSIHGSKGLQAKVVIVADLFSGKQVTMTIENQDRLIVSPEFFAGHPSPWSGQDPPLSAMWRHTRRIHQARKNAEARRLLYVAATRVKQHLIIVGSPKKTEWKDDSGLVVPWGYSESETQLGQMWAESLRQGSWRRVEATSPWLAGDEDLNGPPPISKKGPERILNPAEIQYSAYLGGITLPGLLLYHHPDCLHDGTQENQNPHTPLVQQEMINAQAHNNSVSSITEVPRKDLSARIRLAPHRLSNIDQCPRRHWFETRGGLRPDPISDWREMGEEEWDEREDSDDDKTLNLPDPTQLGLIVHRILEVGIGNPGPEKNKPSKPLPEIWSTPSPSRLLDMSLRAEVFSELLPTDVDEEATDKIVSTMLQRIEDGIVGQMTRGDKIAGIRVEGLRTEFPFTISNKISFEAIERTRWTPEGHQALTVVENANIDMDGSIDLVLCSSGDGKSRIRPVDLKTEQAASISKGSGPLLDTLNEIETKPISEAENEMLRHHRLQLALYHRALTMMENSRPEEERRIVERPAILVGVTGRLIIYPEEMFESAQAELNEILATAARINFSTELPLAEFQRRPAEEASICYTCPFNRGDIPICGPISE